MTGPRPTNRQLCNRFRHILTEGFHIGPQIDRETGLDETRAWRGELWKAFRELEDRLCPLSIKNKDWSKEL